MKAIIMLIVFMAVSFGAAAIGGQFAPGRWYAELVKPDWNPPDWIFAPVWTILYLLIGLSAWLVWKKAGFANGALALSAFAVQLGLNAAWSWIFFGLHRPATAFIEIIILWLAILVTMLLFWRITWIAALLLLPYLLWVSFASLLNWKLWQLNA